MEENRNYAKECGVRCRQIRMSKGMSQQALADLINVTAAAISKWEKEGVANIDHIMRLSNALGQDITSDQFDQDGAISEVGKEILRIVISHRGYADFQILEDNMYGMKSDRISNELFKLVRIGAVIREQYTDYLHNDRDGIFITAKGVIAYKNTIGMKTFAVDKVTTMDERLSNGATSFQDIVDSDVITGILMRLGDNRDTFRCDYLSYLYDNFFNPIINRGHRIWLRNPMVKGIMVGESAYIDILRRMAQKATRADIAGHMNEVADGFFEEFIDSPALSFGHFQIASGVDERNWEAVQYFCREIESMPQIEDVDYSKDDWLKESDDFEVRRAIKDMERWEEEFRNFSEEDYVAAYKRLSDNEEAFFASLTDGDKKKPDLWFSEKEIKKFIEENILPAETEQELRIDNALHEIWQADERTMDYYYAFPKSWEENGLAQLVRDRVGVPKR